MGMNSREIKRKKAWIKSSRKESVTRTLFTLTQQEERKNGVWMMEAKKNALQREPVQPTFTVAQWCYWLDQGERKFPSIPVIVMRPTLSSLCLQTPQRVSLFCFVFFLPLSLFACQFFRKFISLFWHRLAVCTSNSSRFPPKLIVNQIRKKSKPKMQMCATI